MTFKTAAIPSEHIRAIYQKAEEERSQQMPVLSAIAGVLDTQVAAWRTAQMEANSKELADYELKLAEHTKSHRALEIWREASIFFRGSKPQVTPWPHWPPSFYLHPFTSFGSSSPNRDRLDALQREIAEMLDIAGRAQEVQMTPQQVERMREWERGEVLREAEKLLRRTETQA